MRSLVLNRHDRPSMRICPTGAALPSPDGARVAVVEGTDPTQLPARLGVLSLATGQVEWVPDSAGYYPEDWSADGRRLILTHVAVEEPLEFAILDVADLSRAPQRRRADVDPFWDRLGARRRVAARRPGRGRLDPGHRPDWGWTAGASRRFRSTPRSSPPVCSSRRTALGRWSAIASNRGIVVDTVTGATTQVPLAGRPLAWVGNHWLLAQVGDGVERSTHSLSLIDLTGAVTLRVRAPLHPDVIFEVSGRVVDRPRPDVPEPGVLTGRSGRSAG